MRLRILPSRLLFKGREPGPTSALEGLVQAGNARIVRQRLGRASEIPQDLHLRTPTFELVAIMLLTLGVGLAPKDRDICATHEIDVFPRQKLGERIGTQIRVSRRER